MTADQWNKMIPVGTMVRYWPITGYDDEFFDATTRSEAWNLGDGSPRVMIKGKTGGAHLSHILVHSGVET